MSTTATTSPVRIRRTAPEDAESCGRICYDAFAHINRHHNFPPDFPTPEIAVGLIAMLFSHPGFYCVVAEWEGRIVGSNCLDERSAIAGVGPITIAPDAQNAGIGRSLMCAVMDRAREHGFPGVRLLQSAFHSRSLSLYAKLGFAARELMSVMHGPALKRTLESCSVRPATAADVEGADRVCRQVHGHTRSGELRDGIAQGSALVVERHGRITGYATGFGYFAHAVGECNLELQALIGAAEEIPAPGIIVPTRNAELFRWCLENGLRVVQPLTLMTEGLYNDPVGAYLPSILY